MFKKSRRSGGACDRSGAEDYVHQTDLMRQVLGLIFTEVHCSALIAGVNVMNK